MSLETGVHLLLSRNTRALILLISGLCLTLLWPSPARAQRGFGLRMGSEEQDLLRYREYDFNAAVLGDPTELATYRNVAPDALPPGSPLRVRVEENRRQTRERLRRAKQLGLEVCLYTDEIKLPTALLSHLGSRITRDDDPRRVDLEKEEFWNVYRAKYREVLTDFPEVSYIMVRTGENYSFLTDGYTGQLIAANEPRGRHTENYYRHMQRLIEETRKVVVDEFGKKLIWRAWSLGNDGFHSSPTVYERVLAGVKNRNGLIFSLKFTQTDFWRYNDFNPNIGRGGADQIVEFQCAREYEGKGAYPDYVGEEHAAAMRRARASASVKGVWLWDFGGGWSGPYLKSDRWVRLNIYATARLAGDPTLSPRALAREWAAREFGEAAAARVAEMLMLSDDAVLASHYIGAYARKHKGWLPSRNLLRDDVIRGEKLVGEDEGGLRLLYEGSKDELEDVYAEKERGVRLAGEMLRLFDSVRLQITRARGERTFREARDTLVYNEALARVMSHYVQGMFRYYHWRETNDAGEARLALGQLREWENAWRAYETDIPKLGGAATLFRSQSSSGGGQGAPDTSGAMADTVEAALGELESALPQHTLN